MSDLIKLSSVALDCPNAGALAAFYADITGGSVTFEVDAWATVNGPGGRIDFQTVPGYAAPTWPDPTSSIQMHLDFYVDDLVATEARVLAAGATKFDFQPNSDHCYVYADPAGHPFCLSTWPDAQDPGEQAIAQATPPGGDAPVLSERAAHGTGGVGPRTDSVVANRTTVAHRRPQNASTHTAAHSVAPFRTNMAAM